LSQAISNEDRPSASEWNLAEGDVRLGGQFEASAVEKPLDCASVGDFRPRSYADSVVRETETS
jgi:hypothetical protein